MKEDWDRLKIVTYMFVALGMAMRDAAKKQSGIQPGQAGDAKPESGTQDPPRP